jgi:hypothetical protein
MRAITGESPADLSQAGQQLVLRSKFLLLGGQQVEQAAEIFGQGVNDAAVPLMATEQVVSTVMKKAKKTAAGYGGWMFRHLQNILKRSTRLNAPAEFKAFPDHLTRLVNMINRGVLDSTVIWPLLNSVRGVALKKVNKQGEETEDVRPLGISCVFQSLASSLMLRHKDTQSQLAQVISRFDLSFNVRGGAEAIPHAIRALLHLRPDSVVIAGDVKNAFGSFNRVAIAELCERWPAIAPTLRMTYSGSTRFYFPHRVVITTNGGVPQGDVFGGTIFSGVFSNRSYGDRLLHELNRNFSLSKFYIDKDINLGSMLISYTQINLMVIFILNTMNIFYPPDNSGDCINILDEDLCFDKFVKVSVFSFRSCIWIVEENRCIASLSYDYNSFAIV